MARKIKTEAKPATDYKAIFKGFVDLNGMYNCNDIGYALDSAELNAAQTDGVEYFSEEYWQIAHTSIAFTSAFNENEEVRNWFEAQGYRW
jgi:hypothetical protein